MANQNVPHETQLNEELARLIRRLGVDVKCEMDEGESGGGRVDIVASVKGNQIPIEVRRGNEDLDDVFFRRIEDADYGYDGVALAYPKNTRISDLAATSDLTWLGAHEGRVYKYTGGVKDLAGWLLSAPAVPGSD